jgi:hypothetical protein
VNLKLSHRLGLAVLVVGVAVLGVAALSSALSSSSTIYACKRSDGTIHLINKTDRCPSSQKLVTWNTTGPAGAVGARGRDGAPGRDGTPGQPRYVTHFSKGLSRFSNGVPLFNDVNGSYVASCGPAPTGQNTVLAVRPSISSSSYSAEGAFARPVGNTPLASDPRADMIAGTWVERDGWVVIMRTPLAAAVAGQGRTMLSVWTGTVDTLFGTTWIHARLETSDSSCSVIGSAITAPTLS